MCYSLNNIYRRKNKRSYPLRLVCSGFQVHPWNGFQVHGVLAVFIPLNSCLLWMSLGVGDPQVLQTGLAWLCLSLMLALDLWLQRHLCSTYFLQSIDCYFQLCFGSLNINQKLYLPSFNTSDGGVKILAVLSINVFRLLFSSRGPLLTSNSTP